MCDNKCYYCKKTEYDEKFCVQDNGYYRDKCRENKYFCSDKCMKKHIDEKCCQCCHQSSKLEQMKNGKYICDNHYFYHYGYYPSCKEKYYGEYFCDLCKKDKFINNDFCYAIDSCEIYDDCGIDVKCFEDRRFIYCCEECIGPIDDRCWNFRDRYDAFQKINNAIYGYDTIIKKIKDVLNIYENIEFICNECCEKITNRKPKIRDLKNLCDECYDKL